MAMLTKRKIEVGIEADKLRAELGEDAITFPINLDKIARQLGFTVSTFVPDDGDSKDISGAVDRDQKVIFINSSEKIQRQFFTLAHELGHIVLHEEDGSIVDYRDSNKSEPKELEADLFAAELLMPEGKFYEKWYQTEGDKNQIASFFGVSIPAVSVRANTLNLR